MRHSLRLASLFAAAVALSACGGGGNAGAPAPTPTPAPSPAPAEALPSFVPPQPGSTSATGVNAEGLWRNSSNVINFAFVDAGGSVMLAQPVGNVYGQFVYSAGNAWAWQQPNSVFAFTTADPISGTGSYTTGATLTGSYKPQSTVGSTSFSFDAYSNTNALAVTQQSVSGTWAQLDSSGKGLLVTMAADGTLSGTTSGSSFGDCTLTGAVTLATPASAKNLYRMSVTAATGATCKLSQNTPYTGYAAIDFVLQSAATGTTPALYQRTLLFFIKTAAYGYFKAQPAKQN